MFQALQDFWVLPISIIFLISGLFFYFLKSYGVTAKNLKRNLTQSIQAVEELKVKNQKSRYKQSLDQHFQKTTFAHAWNMFSHTLHDSVRVVEGEEQLLASKATVSADYFFNQSIIVDTPLRVEFFKHLPSIMTGIGIIGTFTGLLLGLWQFDPGGDPANVTNSLKLLLHSVTEAFVASGFAILVAMLVTWIEKSLLRTCYAQLEDLTKAIDSLFDADDVGEEYLAKLIKSAEENATQTKQLKDSLVEDLKTMMTNLVAENQKNQQELAQRLAQSYQESGSDMAAKIGESITNSLQAPLEKIAASVSQVSDDNGTAVQGLLENVLIKFMDKLESTFGGQMKGMGDMLAQSVTAMREMQTGISSLIGDMKQSSEAASKVIEQQMLGMLSEIQLKQQDMSDSMTRMLANVENSVSQIGDSGAAAAQKMNTQIAEMIMGLNEKISGMMSGITEQRLAHDQVVAESQNVLHQKTTGLVDGLSEQINKLLEESKNAIAASQDNLNKLTQVSLSSINGMNDGADKMRVAADRFTTAGNSLHSVTEGNTALLTQVNTLSTTLVNTTTGLSTLLADYKQSRDMIGKSIEALEGLIEQAKRESGLSGQMLDDVQAMTNSLAKVREDMVEYLGQVNEVLEKGFNSFNKVVVESLNKKLGEFDTGLARSVSMLSGGIEDLNSVAEDLAQNARRITRG